MHDFEGLVVTLSAGLILAVAAYYVRLVRLRHHTDVNEDDLKPLKRDSLGIVALAVLFYITTHYIVRA